jgi:hypothetical protein
LQKPTEEKYKTPVSLIYTSKLFDFEFSEASEFCENQKNNANLNENMRKGFTQFFRCLKLYLDLLKIAYEGIQIKIFGSVTLTDGVAILRATNKYYGNPWFSNIAVTMDITELFDYQSDDGICYAQVYISKI